MSASTNQGVVSIPVGELDRLQTHAVAALRAAQHAELLARRAGALTVEEQADQAAENARAIVASLQALGARESSQAAAALAHPIPFHALDTPEVRDMLTSLQAILPVAEKIDAARGRALEAPVGGSAGCDLAEDVAQMIARLELEIYGPAPSVTRGRE